PDLSGCGFLPGTEAPNGDAEADAVLSSSSHEASETITDAFGAWYDINGYEDGDECAYVFRNALGGGVGTLYNQVINGAHYYTQDEFSNQDYPNHVGDPVDGSTPGAVYGCFQQEELPTAAFTAPGGVVVGVSTGFN